MEVGLRPSVSRAIASVWITYQHEVALIHWLFLTPKRRACVNRFVGCEMTRDLGFTRKEHFCSPLKLHLNDGVLSGLYQA